MVVLRPQRIRATSRTQGKQTSRQIVDDERWELNFFFLSRMLSLVCVTFTPRSRNASDQSVPGSASASSSFRRWLSSWYPIHDLSSIGSSFCLPQHSKKLLYMTTPELLAIRCWESQLTEVLNVIDQVHLRAITQQPPYRRGQ
jgi:hypothetical protein